MKLTTRKIFFGTETHTCRNCGHTFKGKVCNICGEKVFDEKQLTAKHFFHEVIDFFYHWESKVLKTIKLNFLKPGFVTKQNINGIQVPYAKPVQLYLVVAFVFYLVVTTVNVRDYIPTFGDHHYFSLSDYKLFTWAKPLDRWAVNSIDTMWTKKGITMQKELEEAYKDDYIKNNSLVLVGRAKSDSVVLSPDKLPVIAFRDMMEFRWKLFNSHIGALAKTLIFLVIPFFAGVFYLFFYKKIKYYGASLILATHFMVYNLCIYSLNAVIDIAPARINNNFAGWLMVPFEYVFYNHYTEPVSAFIFGGTFEFFHSIIWMPWLFIAFKRLFDTPWWKNLLISYACSRIFFYLIFGVFKKVLIALTIWSLHG